MTTDNKSSHGTASMCIGQRNRMREVINEPPTDDIYQREVASPSKEKVIKPEAKEVCSLH